MRNEHSAICARQFNEITAAPALLEGQEVNAVLADKACDSNDLRQRIADMKADAVVPCKRTRKVAIPHDTDIYKHRNRLIQLRRFATLYDRRTINFTGFVHLTDAIIWLN